MLKFSQKHYIAFGCIAIAGFAVLTWIFSPQQTNQRDQSISHKKLYDGISKNLKIITVEEDLKLTMLIPGERIKPNTWLFSGNFGEQTLNRPFYGQVTQTCNKVETHACWKIQELVIDGNPYQFEGSELPPSTYDAESMLFSSKKEPNPTSASSITLNLSLSTPPQETHALNTQYHPIKDGVRAYAGPGERYDPVQTVNSDNLLVLNGKKANWGQFYISDQPDELLWINFDHVRKAK